MNQLFIETEKIQDPREGKLQVISNIDTCVKISEILESTLGPYGMDKLFTGENFLITNDGATILKKLKIIHPVGQFFVKLAESQDNEVGDGTTSVVIQTASILNMLKSIIKEDFPLDEIYETLQELKNLCLEEVKSYKVEYNDELLVSLAETAIISKNIRNVKTKFAKMIVEAVKNVKGDLNKIGIKKISGGSISDSFLVNGIAFEKCFTYAGYEQQPKKILNPKILCINVELEWKAERDNAELKIDSIEEYKKIVNTEWDLIKEKLDKIIKSGANVVLSSLPIGDYATQYFAKKNIFCAGRVAKEDLTRICGAFGGQIVSSTNYLENCVSTCKLFEERQIGKERYNYFEGESTGGCTLILKGPGIEVINEVERSVNDALNVIKTVEKHKEVVTGGGSVEMRISKFFKEISKNFSNRKYFICKAVSQSYEKIPYVLAKNFGLDTTITIPLLRRDFKNGKFTSGVGIKGVVDMVEKKVYEPLQTKINIIKTAFDAASMIIMIDSTIVFGNN
ncbi:T-complex protein 1 subunit eta (CCT7) [Vairimorpha necatrix]|uniref:CCT-eta n=1 Tax=Vairimorpha necatrix TaxID=6039 RepID=A0AAX4JEB2_9MICR